MRYGCQSHPGEESSRAVHRSMPMKLLISVMENCERGFGLSWEQAPRRVLVTAACLAAPAYLNFKCPFAFVGVQCNAGVGSAVPPGNALRQT